MYFANRRRVVEEHYMNLRRHELLLLDVLAGHGEALLQLGNRLVSEVLPIQWAPVFHWVLTLAGHAE
jgi:hypothetical protein